MQYKPNGESPVFFVRLFQKDYNKAKREAAAKQLPLSTWARTVILEKLEALRNEK